MPISRITIQSSTTNKDLIFDLNTIQQGWVAQIIEGTFGDTKSYSFTDGKLMNVESKSIDINVRLTPAMTITERTPEEILRFLSGAYVNSKVTLIDTDIQGLSINYINKGDIYNAELSELPSSTWSQNCVIREIKYNYSEKPATIEFTISTMKPFLVGSTLDFYYGIRNTPQQVYRQQFYKIFERLKDLNVYGDIESLAMTFPQSYKDFSRTIAFDGFPYVAYIKTEEPNSPCELWLNKNSSGNKTFTFRGGASYSSSYAYITEAYPMFTIGHVKYLLEAYGYTTDKINTGYGPVAAWIRFVQIKKGL